MGSQIIARVISMKEVWEEGKPNACLGKGD